MKLNFFKVVVALRKLNPLTSQFNINSTYLSNCETMSNVFCFKLDRSFKKLHINFISGPCFALIYTSVGMHNYLW